MAEQRDLVAVPGQAGHQGPQGLRALPRVARGEDGRAEQARGPVAEPGDDRQAGAGIQPAGLRGQRPGAALRRGGPRDANVASEVSEPGTRIGDPPGGGQVAEDLDRLALAARVEAQQVLVAAERGRRAGQAGLPDRAAAAWRPGRRPAELAA